MTTLTTGKATDFIQFSRASSATVVDSDGKIKWAPHNLLLASEQFDASNWTRSGLSGVTANSVIAPNGTMTGDLLVENSSNDVHRVTQSYTPVANSTITVGAFVKQHTAGRNLQMVVVSGADVAGDTISSADGTSLSSALTGTAFSNKTSLTTVSVGNGFYYVSFSVTVTVSTAILVLFGVTNGTSVVYTGNGTAGLYLWGAHLYRSDLGGMQANTSAYPMYNPTTPKNLLGFSESLTTGWTNTNTTDAIASEVNPVGLTGAVDVAATAGNGTLLASVSLLASPYTFSIWLKRKTGSGTVEITVDGTTYVSAAVTTTWTRFSTTLTPSAGTKTPGIRLVTSGDAVYAWGAQLSDSASLDTYVPSYGAAPTAAAYYGPRRDFDAVTLACRGLLVEEQRTNLLFHSAAFDNAAWNLISTTVDATNVVAPSGEAVAETLTFAASSSSQAYQNITLTAATYTASVWAKTSSGTKNFRINYYNGTTSVASSNFTATTTWQRFTYAFTGAAATGNVAIINDSTGAAGSIDVWGAQVELGSFATSYIPTGSATATRSADVASVSTQAFPYNQPEGSLVVNFTPTNTIANNTRISELSGGGSARVIDLYSAGTSWAIYNGTTTFTAGTPVLGATTKIAAAYKTGSYGMSVNGGAVTADASSLVNTATAIYIGGNSVPSSLINGHIRQITYLPRRLTNAELQSRTA